MTSTLLLFCFLRAWHPAHDLEIAVFRLYESSSAMHLQASLDVSDLCQEMGIAEKNLSLENIHAYLAKHVTFTFDETDYAFIIQRYRLEKDHLIAQGIFKQNPSTFSLLTVENKCLLTLENHSNIMQLELRNRSRDFRMHRERDIIRVSY